MQPANHSLNHLKACPDFFFLTFLRIAFGAFAVVSVVLQCTAAEALSFQNERVWTGTNGKTFRGSWSSVENKTGSLVIVSDRLIYRIDPANLSENDRKWIAPFQERTWTRADGTSFVGAWRQARANRTLGFAKPGNTSLSIPIAELSDKDRRWLADRYREMPGSGEDRFVAEMMATLAAGDGATFLPESSPKRSSFPVINQSDYGNKASDCVPSSFCSFLLWWDQQNYLPIDKRGDFGKKAEYIHSRMARYFGTRNTAGTSMKDAEEGIRAYFEKDLKDLATYRILSDPDCSVENLRRYMDGPSATLLEVSVYYGRKYESSHVVALADIEANGDLLIHTWGCKIRGRLKPVKPDAKAPRGSAPVVANHYEIEFLNQTDLPEWIANNDVHLEIDPDRWDGLTVIKPYRFAKPGQPAPPPADPLMQSARAASK